MTNPADQWLAAHDRSHYRERLLEHVIITRLLEAGVARELEIEVLRGEVDRFGYDLVLEAHLPRSAHPKVRHVQLKSTVRGASKEKVAINAALMDHEGWCVVWADWFREGDALHLDFRWLEEPMPSGAQVDAKDNWILGPALFLDEGRKFGADEILSLLFPEPAVPPTDLGP